MESADCNTRIQHAWVQTIHAAMVKLGNVVLLYPYPPSWIADRKSIAETHAERTARQGPVTLAAVRGSLHSIVWTENAVSKTTSSSAQEDGESAAVSMDNMGPVKRFVGLESVSQATTQLLFPPRPPTTIKIVKTRKQQKYLYGEPKGIKYGVIIFGNC